MAGPVGLDGKPDDPRNRRQGQTERYPNRFPDVNGGASSQPPVTVTMIKSRLATKDSAGQRPSTGNPLTAIKDAPRSISIRIKLPTLTATSLAVQSVSSLLGSMPSGPVKRSSRGSLQAGNRSFRRAIAPAL